MKDLPIIFSGSMIPPILDDTKNMTRRLDGLKRVNQEPDLWAYGGINKFGEHIFYPTEEGEARYPNGYPDDFNGLVKCPYEPPQRRWVRETWAHCQPILDIKKQDGRLISEISDGYAAYKADGFDTIQDYKDHIKLIAGHDVIVKNDKWCPSIFMFRWASRITLEVLSAPPERIQDISEEDIEREGVLGDSYLYELGITKRDPHSARIYFMELWDSLYAKRGYGSDVNNWVWAVSFKRLK